MDRAYDLLLDSGMPVRVVSSAMLAIGARSYEVRARLRPTPYDLRREHERLARRSPNTSLAYVVPRISPALAETAAELADVAVLGVEDLVLIASGETTPLGAMATPISAARSPRRAWGRFAVMRALVQHPGPHRQSELAAIAGISQAAVSKAVKALGTTAADARQGSRDAAEELWERFLTDYPGPHGITAHWYSLDPVAQQAAQVQERYPDVLVSADAGADRLAPWRAVRHAVVYSNAGIDLAELGFAEADPEDSTLSVVVPADHTIVSTARAWQYPPDGLHTADPLIVAWDVRRSGGADAEDAVARLKARVFDAWR